MRFVGILMILALGLTIASITFADDAAEKTGKTEETAQKSGDTGAGGREPASTGSTMSRESEDALRGAVSRVNQLMDTASKSAPDSVPSNSDDE